MPVDPNVVIEQIKALGKIDTFGTKKEVRHLPKVLMEGENILGLCSGWMDRTTWLCTITNKRVLLLDKGFLWGLKQLDLPVHKIKSVNHRTGLFFGEILIDTGGRIKRMKYVKKSDAPKIAALLGELLHNQNSAPVVQAPQAPAPEGDVISQLQRLASLKDQGILTDDEFAAQKAKLLNG